MTTVVPFSILVGELFGLNVISTDDISVHSVNMVKLQKVFQDIRQFGMSNIGYLHRNPFYRAGLL